MLGFRVALEQHGCELPDAGVRLVGRDLDWATQAAGDLLDAEDRPTAISRTTTSSQAAYSAQRTVADRVPEELAVVGFDDSELAEHLELTSVRQPFEESGQVAAEMLLAQLRDPKRSLQHVTLKLTLVERATT